MLPQKTTHTKWLLMFCENADKYNVCMKHSGYWGVEHRAMGMQEGVQTDNSDVHGFGLIRSYCRTRTRCVPRKQDGIVTQGREGKPLLGMVLWASHLCRNITA